MNMDTKIINSFNEVLEGSLEMEELEKRIEMMILSPEMFMGDDASVACDEQTQCDGYCGWKN